MKKIIQLLIILLFIASSSSAQSKSSELKLFFENIMVLQEDQVNGVQPLVQLASILDDAAAKKIILTKENVQEALQEASKYKHTVLLVGNHSLVKIIDLNDCIPSGAWATCMPKGNALIQKGGVFIQRTDYINQLIGVPDGQVRTVYLLN
ncbi:MAG: hypothetical protein ACERKD_17520 [Prolixibacteraceae bacterium]